ncbi:MAG: F-box protein [Candidatus Protochlamydia sp.]|nr:F-box protein [Candidatus Protochlamydia sp.]
MLNIAYPIFFNIPIDIQIQCLSFLTPYQLFESRLVSKEWQGVTKNVNLWIYFLNELNIDIESSKNPDRQSVIFTEITKYHKEAETIISFLYNDQIAIKFCSSVSLNDLKKMHILDRSYYIISGSRKILKSKFKILC